MADESPPRGTVVLRNDTGRSLRKAPAAVSSSSVIDCCGDFRAGDAVNVTFRGGDGGQFAIANAVVGMDAATLRRQVLGGTPDTIVIAECDLHLLWRS